MSRHAAKRRRIVDECHEDDHAGDVSPRQAFLELALVHYTPLPTTLFSMVLAYLAEEDKAVHVWIVTVTHFLDLKDDWYLRDNPGGEVIGPSAYFTERAARCSLRSTLADLCQSYIDEQQDQAREETFRPWLDKTEENVIGKLDAIERLVHAIWIHSEGARHIDYRIEFRIVG